MNHVPLVNQIPTFPLKPITYKKLTIERALYLCLINFPRVPVPMRSRGMGPRHKKGEALMQYRGFIFTRSGARLIHITPSPHGGVEQRRIIAHEIRPGVYAVRRPRGGGYGLVYQDRDGWSATSSWGRYLNTSFPAALICAAYGRMVYRTLRDAIADYPA